MNSERDKSIAIRLNERLATSGLRFTAQRQRVYEVLLSTRDHPTAEEVFMRSKHSMPEISLATVYNCLDALVKCNLVRQVNLDRGASRFCPNMKQHLHFHCEQCGGVHDIDLTTTCTTSQIELPKGFKVNHAEISFRGLCPECSAKG